MCCGTPPSHLNTAQYSTMALVALCLVFDSNQTRTWSDQGGKPNSKKRFLNSLGGCIYHLYTHRNLCVVFFRYWRQISKRKRLGSVYGCLPSALEAFAGFLKVVPTLFNSQNQAQTDLLWICCAWFIKKGCTWRWYWHPLADARSSEAFNEGLHCVQLPGNLHKANQCHTYNPILPGSFFLGSRTLARGAPSPSRGTAFAGVVRFTTSIESRDNGTHCLYMCTRVTNLTYDTTHCYIIVSI